MNTITTIVPNTFLESLLEKAVLHGDFGYIDISLEDIAPYSIPEVISAYRDYAKHQHGSQNWFAGLLLRMSPELFDNIGLFPIGYHTTITKLPEVLEDRGDNPHNTLGGGLYMLPFNPSLSSNLDVYTYEIDLRSVPSFLVVNSIEEKECEMFIHHTTFSKTQISPRLLSQEEVDTLPTVNTLDSIFEKIKESIF